MVLHKSQRSGHSPPFQGGVPERSNVRTLGRGGYPGTAKRTLFNWKLLTAPSAPLRNGSILLLAQPPRLGKAGNVPLDDFLCKASPDGAPQFIHTFYMTATAQTGAKREPDRAKHMSGWD